MPTPLVSVIIPAYNAASCLHKSVEAAKAQTLKDIEILIIDDKSTDNTVEVAQKLAKTDKRIRVFQQEKNGGPSAARNRGMREAKGEWIAVLDDDDIIYPERLEIMLAEAIKQKADFILDNLEMQDPGTGAMLGPAIPLEQRASGILSLADYVTGCDPFHPGVKLANLQAVFKKSLVTDNGIFYPESYRYGEDLIFYTEIFLTNPTVYYLKEPYYVYLMQVGKSGQKNPFTRTIHDTSQLIRATEDLLTKWNASLPPASRTVLRQRIAKLKEFQAYTTLKQAIRHRKVATVMGLLVKKPSLVLRLAQQVVNKIPQLV